MGEGKHAHPRIGGGGVVCYGESPVGGTVVGEDDLEPGVESPLGTKTRQRLGQGGLRVVRGEENGYPVHERAPVDGSRADGGNA